MRAASWNAAGGPNRLRPTVPGAVIVHNQLHVRGGHQVEWRIDGVAVPNTNIASNVGPQFDPKDVDYLEAQRGGFTADYGDRAYGVFNVETRSGFERDNVVGAGRGQTPGLGQRVGEWLRVLDRRADGLEAELGDVGVELLSIERLGECG